MNCAKKRVGKGWPTNFGSEGQNFGVVADALRQMSVERTSMTVGFFHKGAKAVCNSAPIPVHSGSGGLLYRQKPYSRVKNGNKTVKQDNGTGQKEP
jgi:hypothetical protein